MSRDKRIQSWKRMCLAKARMSEQISKKVAAEWNQRAYLCPYCAGWHCTKQKVDAQSKKDSRSGIVARLREFPWKAVPVDVLEEVWALIVAKATLVRPKEAYLGSDVHPHAPKYVVEWERRQKAANGQLPRTSVEAATGGKRT